MAQYKPSEELIQKTINAYLKEGKIITTVQAEEIVRTLAGFGEILFDWYQKLSVEEKEKFSEGNKKKNTRRHLFKRVSPKSQQ